MKVAEIVTEKIIEQLQNGTIPWHKPWSSKDTINYVSRKHYRGINIMLLQKPGEYLTFNQVKELGGSIKKGSKASMVVFWKMYEKDGETDNHDSSNDGKDAKKIPVLRYYNVFHIDDCEGIPSKIIENKKDISTIPDKDKFVNDYMIKTGITYKQETSNQAYYRVEDDSINLPLTNQFDSTEEYYSVLFHEMAHSTGSKQRLNRLELAQYHNSKQVRSKEELTAEIASAALMSDTGLDTDKTLKNSAAYVQSWVKVLKDDCNMILQAASRAQKAVDYIKESSATC